MIPHYFDDNHKDEISRSSLIGFLNDIQSFRIYIIIIIWNIYQKDSIKIYSRTSLYYCLATKPNSYIQRLDSNGHQKDDKMTYISLVLGQKERIPDTKASNYCKNRIKAPKYSSHYQHFSQLGINRKYREKFPWLKENENKSRKQQKPTNSNRLINNQLNRTEKQTHQDW
jgi:hypothetical protein